jgi:hypothetical protein
LVATQAGTNIFAAPPTKTTVRETYRNTAAYWKKDTLRSHEYFEVTTLFYTKTPFLYKLMV